jgi:formylglycine-generating enzyme required for sulfatase activity
MKHLFITVAILTGIAAEKISAAPPVVTNVRASQIAGTKNVEILYDVTDADGDVLTIGMQVSGDAGQSYTIPATSLSGHIGAGVAPGLNRRIVWNAGADWNGQLVSSAKVRVTASDGSTPVPPPGMVYIPAGPFQMGDSSDGDADALPVRMVSVSAFFAERYEVTRTLWNQVRQWGVANGYSFTGGVFAVSLHPAENLDWYDAVKWCNARSEMDGLTPCYYLNDEQTAVLRSSTQNVTVAQVKWSANGYRLPTEAEWEKAARGGLLGRRYPWGDTIDANQANFIYSGDTSEPGSTPVGYYNGNQTPPGLDMANGYGLYDIAGNVLEWCWDSYSSSYYGDPTSGTDPRGPPFTGNRTVRGGSYDDLATSLRVARRIVASPDSIVVEGLGGTGQSGGIGIRCVRRATP